MIYSNRAHEKKLLLDNIKAVVEELKKHEQLDESVTMALMVLSRAYSFILHGPESL